MQLYLPTDRQEVEKLILWKGMTMSLMINNEPKANIQDGDHIGIAPRVINSIFSMVEESGAQSGNTYRVY